MTSLSHGGMSTEWLYALTKGKDVPIGETLFPYYGDVSGTRPHFPCRAPDRAYPESCGAYDLEYV
jgi:hypothetical protein